MKDRIGELLVQQNLLSSDDLKRAQNEARATGTRAGVQLTKLGLIDGAALADFMSKQYGLPSIDLADFEIDPEVIELIPQEVALKHQVIPVNRAGSTLIIATGDPSNIFALDDIKFFIELKRHLGFFCHRRLLVLRLLKTSASAACSRAHTGMVTGYRRQLQRHGADTAVP